MTTQSLNQVYDGNAVSAPEYMTAGSDGKTTIKWQKNAGKADTPKWKTKNKSITTTYEGPQRCCNHTGSGTGILPYKILFIIFNTFFDHFVCSCQLFRGDFHTVKP